ncbi:DJ-1/PfpI family protein-like protein [Dendryphion nanum]|uniref:DJ-1/PfpI family protein-like protein n=1 Tax=Dendryphion nanum TaxID=256645 RepID=A0A9P9IDI1_9PLEO|nr:DJ-1/PfpI family protein-like protein [Dendryphion nanum]
MPVSPLPIHFAVALFPGFQLLDATGPLDVLNILAYTKPIRLSIIAASLSPVSTHHAHHTSANSHFSQAIVPTHTFETAPKDIEVLLIPGGFGSRKEENLDGLVDWIREVYPSLRWCLTVCTGSAILAKTGVLNGRKATSNKKAFAWVREQNTAVEWVPKARWVVDGNIWTSSGISAGIDLIYAWLAEVYGEETASLIADSSEYERRTEAGDDRFADRWSAV